MQELSATPVDHSPGSLAFLGLDVGQNVAVACLLLGDGREPVHRWNVPNTLPGAEDLARRLLTLARMHGFRQVRIGLEATSLYWWHLACFLKDSPLLADLHHEVYALNPKLVYALKKCYSDSGKTDQLDAFFIAERLRIGRLPAPFQVDAVYAPLQRLTRFRTHLSQTLAREKNYFLTFLFLKFSGFGQSNPFSDPFGTTSGAVLADFTTEQLAQTPLEELTQYVAAKGHHKFKDPEEVATTLQRAARDSFKLDQMLDKPLELVLATTMATIRTLQAQLRDVDKTIARELQALPQDRRVIDSIPGLGPVWTAGLVSEIGNIFRFHNDADLAKFAGLVWKPYQTSSFQGEDTTLAKTGNTYLRYYLVEAANSVRQHCPEYRVYYEAKYTQSPKHANKRALVLTARKLVRLIDSLLRDGAVYRPPESRPDQKEATTPPHAARPKPQRRAPLAQSAL
jgi:transposase